MTIPASAIVNVIPGVVTAGGAALDLNGVMLTNNTRVPIGSVLPFSNATDVATFFGPNTTEAAQATIYFAGYINGTLLPARLYFVQYVSTTPVAAYLRGTSLAALTLTQLQAISGTLTVTIDGAAKTGSPNLSAATSFSNAATIIATALSISSPQTVTYDSVSSAFVVTSGTTGPSSTITLGTGSAAAPLGLAAGTLSQGAAVSTPSAAMYAITAVTQNFATFMTLFEPNLNDKLAFAAWEAAQNNRFMYVAWDTDTNASVANNTTALGPVLAATNTGGVFPISGDPAQATALGVSLASLLLPVASFTMGAVASTDFGRLNGRITLDAKSQASLVATVTNQTTYANLLANGYNVYGAFGTANAGFTFLNPGSISGAFLWADAYTDQIWLNSNFQLALMTLLVNTPSIPYNTIGYGLIRAALLDPITAAINFGAIRIGITLSALQAAEVNNAAGVQISDVLFNTGWYLQVLDPGAQARAQRTTPRMTFWYTDGGSVQSFTLASLDVQ